MDLVAFENALQAWVAAGLGVSTIWSSPNAPPPAKPYAYLTLVGPARLGLNGELVSSTAIANPAGQEIVQTLTEHQEWVLSVQGIATPTSGAGTARALLSAGAMALRLPTPIETLRAAGVAVIEVGDTQDLSALFAADIESRAKFDVRLRTVDVATEKTGYIDQVGVTPPWGPAFRAPKT